MREHLHNQFSQSIGIATIFILIATVYFFNPFFAVFLPGFISTIRGTITNGIKASFKK